MKYMISWFERPQGSPMEYENAQKRILEVFTQWKAPDNFKIEVFVVRVGEWGGHMLVECDDPATVHKVCSTWPAFEFQARPVIPLEEAVRGSNWKRWPGAMDCHASDVRGTDRISRRMRAVFTRRLRDDLRDIVLYP